MLPVHVRVTGGSGLFAGTRDEGGQQLIQAVESCYPLCASSQIYSTASLVVDSRNAVRVQRLRRVCALFFDVGYRLIATVVGEMYVSLYSYIPLSLIHI